MEKSKGKQDSQEDTDALLEHVRKADAKATEPLVESLELMILSVIKNFRKGVASIRKPFDSGKKEFFKLPERKVNSSISERFFRFGTWNIKPAIL